MEIFSPPTLPTWPKDEGEKGSIDAFVAVGTFNEAASRSVVIIFVVIFIIIIVAVVIDDSEVFRVSRPSRLPHIPWVNRVLIRSTSATWMLRRYWSQ